MADPHIPVLLNPLLRAVGPVTGTWLDGTFGAGGYARGLLAAGADRVIGVDRDPLVFDMAAGWAGEYGNRLRLVEGTFSDLDLLAREPLDGVVLDLGVSSMQLDLAERGFSFLRDGPLDMRMEQAGPSAADLLNSADEPVIADVLYHYGEERAARRIARAIVAARPLTRTAQLAEVVASCLPRPKPGQIHPATRSFQAIRIWVNDEFRQLVDGLSAAERAEAGRQAGRGQLPFAGRPDRQAVHAGPVEQRGRGSRYAPVQETAPAAFTMPFRRAIGPDPDEEASNPRARSALLRVAVRTDAPAGAVDADALAMPRLPKGAGDASADLSGLHAFGHGPGLLGLPRELSHPGLARRDEADPARDRGPARGSGRAAGRMGLSEPARKAARTGGPELRPPATDPARGGAGDGPGPYRLSQAARATPVEPEPGADAAPVE
ncbi:16S rRNA (cytosine(1402)-N(4))-methyltransferase RsmH [Paracoccus aerius]